MELPVDIMLDILTRLPTDSVLESKLVCKTWRDVVRHSTFSQKHFNRLISSADDSGNSGFILNDEEWESKGFYYFEYSENNETPITSPRKINLGRLDLELGGRSCNVVGSCNGLICLISLCDFIICNPITREFVVLPEMELCHLYGFGYLASTNEYKVVRMYELEDGISLQVQVYTLGSGKGWRNVERLSSGLSSLKIGVLANEALHWMTQKRISMTSGKRISMTFDLADEKFREISVPEIQDVNFKPVGSLGDSLMCVDYRRESGVRSLDIWLLKENGVRDMNWEAVRKSMSWSEEFDVGDMEPFAFTNSGAVLCFKVNERNLTVYRYDVKLSSLEMLVSFGKPVFWPPSAHMKTLVSLKALGEENTKRMECSLVTERND